MPVDITGLDRADVLRVLYDNSRPLGLGFLHFTPEPMTNKQAEELTNDQEYFDYVGGRVIKVMLRKGATEFDEWLYDRDNGPGAAQRAVDMLRS